MLVTCACSGAPSVYSGARDGGQQRVEQRVEVLVVGHLAVARLVHRRPAGPRGAVDDRELDLLVGGVQVEEQRVGLVDDLVDPGVRAVGLVDHQHHRQLRLQRLAQHEPGLRQRALGGVDQQHDAVDHHQRPLHLAAEVGVPGGVDDVDHHVAAAHRGVLGQDGDALFPLQVVGVHHPVGVRGTDPERAGLPEHGVDQRGLAVVDVRHDRHVAQVGTNRTVSHGWSTPRVRVTLRRHRDGGLWSVGSATHPA